MCKAGPPSRLGSTEVVGEALPQWMLICRGSERNASDSLPGISQPQPAFFHSRKAPPLLLARGTAWCKG